MTWDVQYGDCLEELKYMEDESVHAVICDPPYGLSFMSKKWDYDVPDVEIWKECLRVLKPGGHLLAFGGTRTYHRLTVAAEDAGFEIMGMVGWIYGSGFPKAVDLGKAIDKRAGKKRDMVPRTRVDGKPTGKAETGFVSGADRVDITPGDPVTEEAEYWDGWKYSINPLKPALEPILMARKPFDGKPVDSILKHEVGAVNIDATRCVSPSMMKDQIRSKESSISKGIYGDSCEQITHQTEGQKEGRYPANVLLDPDGAEAIGKQSGECKTGNIKPHKEKCQTEWGKRDTREFRDINHKGSTGTADRFFNQFEHSDEPPFLYCAKASRKERDSGLNDVKSKKSKVYAEDEWTKKNMGNTPANLRKPVKNNHPTVKPIKLMRWLVKLVTRKGQTVVDPFCGSGTTGCACVLEDREFIGMDMEPEYVDITIRRIQYWEGKKNENNDSW